MIYMPRLLKYEQERGVFCVCHRVHHGFWDSIWDKVRVVSIKYFLGRNVNSRLNLDTSTMTNSHVSIHSVWSVVNTIPIVNYRTIEKQLESAPRV